MTDQPRETVMGGQDLPGFVGDAVAAALAARPTTETVWTHHGDDPLPARVRAAEVEARNDLLGAAIQRFVEADDEPETDLRDAIADALAPFVGQHDMYRAADHVLDEVPQVVAALAARPVTDLRDAIAELADNWRRKSVASPQDFADSVLKVLAVRPVAAQEWECTCYPGGVSPETYEGPQEWCDVHGLPSAAYALGLRQGAESPMPVAAQERIDTALAVYAEQVARYGADSSAMLAADRMRRALTRTIS